MFYLYFYTTIIDLYFFDTNETIFNLLLYIFNLFLCKESSFLFFFLLIISFKIDFEKDF